MKTRQIRDLAIKILGLYYLAHAIIYLPQIAGLFAMTDKESGFVQHKAIFLMASLVPILLWFVVAYVLILKSGIVMALLWPRKDLEADEEHPSLALATWVSLIGLFYLIGSLAGAASELYVLGVKREMLGSWLSYKFLPDLITLGMSLICIIKARQIADYLKKKTE